MDKATLDSLEQQLNQIIKEGDLIFISIDSFLYRQVARGTGSWTSHIGFIIKQEQQWFVWESAVPKVKCIPLRDFIARTTNNEISIRRLKQPLTNEQISQLKQAAQARKGQFYHLGFKFDSNRQFCSKFVYLCFKEALGVEVGKIQTLEELLEENPQASVSFWRVWYFGFIPWKRRTITPACQLKDPDLLPIYDSVAGQ